MYSGFVIALPSSVYYQPSHKEEDSLPIVTRMVQRPGKKVLARALSQPPCLLSRLPSKLLDHCVKFCDPKDVTFTQQTCRLISRLYLPSQVGNAIEALKTTNSMPHDLPRHPIPLIQYFYLSNYFKTETAKILHFEGFFGMVMAFKEAGAFALLEDLITGIEIYATQIKLESEIWVIEDALDNILTLAASGSAPALDIMRRIMHPRNRHLITQVAFLNGLREACNSLNEEAVTIILQWVKLDWTAYSMKRIIVAQLHAMKHDVCIFTKANKNHPEREKIINLLAKYRTILRRYLKGT